MIYGDKCSVGVFRKVREFLADESAAAAVEYAILLAAIAAVIALTVKMTGTKTNNSFKKVLSSWGGSKSGHGDD